MGGQSPALRLKRSRGHRTRKENGGGSQVDPISLEVGYGLISMVDDTNGGKLLNRIKSIRKLSTELGFVFPSVRKR